MVKQSTPTHGMPPVHATKQYYSDGSTRVTDKIVTVGGTVYSIAHLTSVYHGVKRPNYLERFLVGLFAGGAAGVLIGIIFMDLLASTLVGILSFLICVIVALFIAFFTARTEYVVTLRFSSGEHRTVHGKDAMMLHRLSGSAIQAMVENQ